jgi:hypothetical protein
MNDDPNFKNPSLTGNWTGGMDYWKCPRCHGEDVYKSKIPTGTVGPIQEVGDSGNFIGAQRSLFVDIWKCRACGEIATKFTRKKTAKEIEEGKIFTEDFKPSDIPIQVFLGLLVILGGAIAFVALMIELFA